MTVALPDNYATPAVVGTMINQSFMSKGNKPLIKQIMRDMGSTGDIVISFLVETDINGTDRKTGNIFYHAADAYFSFRDQQVKLDVRLSTYKENQYTQEALFDDQDGHLKALPAPEQGDESSLVGLSADKELEVKIKRFEIIDAKHRKWFNDNYDQLPPTTRLVSELIHNSFPEGLPLPNDQRALRCIFNVELLTGQKYESLTLCKSIKGVVDGQRFHLDRISGEVWHAWGWTAAKQGEWNYPHGIESMERSREIVQGTRKPRGVTARAQLVSSVAKPNLVLQIKDANGAQALLPEDSTPRICELEEATRRGI